MAPLEQTTTAGRPEQIILKQASSGEPSILAFRASVSLALGRPSSLRSAGDKTTFDANLNQHAANTSPRKIVQLGTQKKKRRISQLPICDAHLLSINMLPTAQCPVPLEIPGQASTATSKHDVWQG